MKMSGLALPTRSQQPGRCLPFPATGQHPKIPRGPPDTGTRLISAIHQGQTNRSCQKPDLGTEAPPWRCVQTGHRGQCPRSHAAGTPFEDEVLGVRSLDQSFLGTTHVIGIDKLSAAGVPSGTPLGGGPAHCPARLPRRTHSSGGGPQTLSIRPTQGGRFCSFWRESQASMDWGHGADAVTPSARAAQGLIPPRNVPAPGLAWGLTPDTRE
uniref:Uncharacterized protein n=1 Tax=Rangifer tarandus platyrhynchus TaxID=3082113 RepID=A0ACB0EJ62_RANTA|nr:unnamed protein product [Rangifer tarandus platyrhynchus]